MKIMNQLLRVTLMFVDALAGGGPVLKAVMPWHEAALRGQVTVAEGAVFDSNS